MSSSALEPVFVYYDTETTGLDTASCEVTEFAACLIDGSRWWTSLVKPKLPVPAEVTKFTGISDETVKDAQPFSVAMPPFFAWLEERRAGADVILVAHNNFNYDEIVLRRQCAESGLAVPAWMRFADTLPIFRSCFASTSHRSNSLQALAKRFKVTGTQTHRARGDVDMLMRVVDSCPDKALVLEQLVRECH